VQFRVLGAVEVRDDDGLPVPLAGDRQHLLLATLLSRRGRPVPVDVLVEALWGERLPSHPSAALQSQVHRLRRALPVPSDGGWQITTRNRCYVLEVADEVFDAACFERLLATARAAAPAEQVHLLDRALELWQGPAYGGLAEVDSFLSADALRLEAMRLDEARCDAVELWAEAALSCNLVEEAVSRLDGFVREHPLRERARSAYMRALYRRGRHADALASYGEYRTYLADELGLEPSAAMQRLEVEILRQEVAEPPVAQTAGQGLHSGGEAATGVAPGPEGPVADASDEPTVAVPHQPTASDPPDVPSPALDRMRVAYLRLADGRQIAYGKVGSGPSVVASPGWVSSLAVIAAGRDPRSSLFQRLVPHIGLTLYDRYGTGLSPGEVTDYGLDASVAELEAVIERAGAPVHLLGMSQAGPVAVAVAAKRPELVRRLVLWGTYASGPQTFRRADINASVVGMVRAHWGMGSRMFPDLYQPGISPGAARHFARVLRDSAPQDVAAAYLEQVFDVDVSGLLPLVEAPSLVVHYGRDRVIPFVGGQQLAAGLRDCTFLPLEGWWHLPQAADLDRVTEVIREFLT
jgi:DNA-binding SARP family transcriptional activator/pimeloyl-ACP methyl ester carboxylesterase